MTHGNRPPSAAGPPESPSAHRSLLPHMVRAPEAWLANWAECATRLPGSLFDAPARHALAAEARLVQHHARRTEGALPGPPTTAQLIALVVSHAADLDGPVTARTREAIGHCATQAPGAARVAAALRECARLAAGEGSAAQGHLPWAEWGLALLMLDGSIAHAPGSGDALTRAAARQAARLLYGPGEGHGSGDLRDAHPLDGGVVARLMEGAAEALRRYLESGTGEAQLFRELALFERQARPGPPPGHPSEDMLRQWALQERGCPWPLALPARAGTRPAITLEVPEGLAGIPAFTGGGDLNVRWFAPPNPEFVRYAAVLRPDEVLHVHRVGPSDDARFAALARLATERARHSGRAYGSELREALRQDGIRAIARYDHVRPVSGALAWPQEVVLVDAAAPGVTLVWESTTSDPGVPPADAEASANAG